MPLWTNVDEAEGAPIYAPAQVHQAPNTDNRDALYGNTTADATIEGATVSLVGISADEMSITAFVLGSAVPNNAGSGYTPGDVLTVSNTGAGDANVITEATLTVATIELANASVDSACTSGVFVPNDHIILDAWEGDPAELRIITVQIDTAEVNASGTGYANGDTVTLAGAGYTQDANDRVIFEITTGAANSSVVSIALADSGNVTHLPAAGVNAIVTANVTGAGSGLTIKATFDPKDVEIVDRGAYTEETDSYTIGTIADGATSTGTPQFNVAFRIKELTVTEPGLYKALPNVAAAALSGGTGEDATAVLSFNDSYAEGKKASGSPGWALRVEGSGGRAGRVTYETLAVVKKISTDADSDVLPS